MNAITQGFRNLFPTWLTLAGDPSTGNNFTCVSLTATGDIPCRALEVSYRLDTPSARGYLAAQGVPLP
jgi:hypothetical protein